MTGGTEIDNIKRFSLEALKMSAETAGREKEAHHQAIREVIEKIRPFLVRDGGDCELVDVSEDGKTVYLRLKGACSFCPSAIYTLKLGIEQALREQVPGVEKVEAVP